MLVRIAYTAVAIGWFSFGGAAAQEVRSKVHPESGALGVCEMNLIDPGSGSSTVGHDLVWKVFPSLALCNKLLPTDCKINLLGKLVYAYVVGALNDAWDMEVILKEFYDSRGLRSYARWECFEIPGGERVISEPEDLPEFTKDWEPVRIPALPPNVNVDDVVHRYPNVAFPGLSWDLAVRLTQAERLGFVERTAEQALVFTAAGALAYAGYAWAVRQMAFSTLAGGLRAAPVPVAVLLLSGAVLSGSSRAYQEIEEAPWRFAELPSDQQRDVLDHYPNLVKRIREFDASLEKMLATSLSRGFDMIFPGESATPIYTAGDSVRLTMPVAADHAEVSLYDAKGTLIDRKTYFRSALDWVIHFPTQTMSPGIYYAAMMGFGPSANVESAKIVKFVYLR